MLRYKDTKVQRHKGTKVQHSTLQQLGSHNGMALLNGMELLNGLAPLFGMA